MDFTATTTPSPSLIAIQNIKPSPINNPLSSTKLSNSISTSSQVVSLSKSNTSTDSQQNSLSYNLPTSSSSILKMRTSHSHPIQVSWIFPEQFYFLQFPYSYLFFLNSTRTLSHPDILDVSSFLLTNNPSNTFSHPSLSSSLDSNNTNTNTNNKFGNICLSSCPGKKVRLNGPVGGRSSVRRELNIDLPRLSGMGVTTIVNCLDNEELEYIGAPWPEYSSEAASIQIDVLRLPIVEGEAPKDINLLLRVLDSMHERLKNGQNILIHCRGGIGRAALVACSYLLRYRFIKSALRSIQFIRLRRSPRAIETIAQEQFLEMFEHQYRLN